MRWRRRLGGLRLSIEVHGARGPGGPRPLELQVVRRGGDVVARLRPSTRHTVREQDGRPTVSVLDVVVGDRILRRHPGAVLNLTLAVPNSRERSRVAVPLISVLPQPRRGMRPYATVHDNLSIEVGAP